MGRSPDVAGGWLPRLRQLAREFASVRRDIKRRFGFLAPLRVAMYGGYGTTDELIVRGRVLEERERAAPSLLDSPLSNFRRAFWQFESDEVPHVELELDLGGGEKATVVSDEDGYFALRHRFAMPAAPGWRPVRARVTRAPYPTPVLPSAEGRVLIPSPGARFGVISDIDETILKSFVQNRPLMVYLTLVGNHFTRQPFEGTTELYRGLRESGQGAPFFYVSKSMWNLFPLLELFITHQHLPRGALLLRRLGLLGPRPSVPHKANAIRELLELYPTLPFLLIGDSGEHDLELYLGAARTFPGRVQAILIRNVSAPAQRAALQRTAEQSVPAGCRVLLFDDTRQAIELCKELGCWQSTSLVSLPPPPG